MPITDTRNSRGGFALGSQGQTTFTGVDQTAAELARDNYFTANPSILTTYDNNPTSVIRLIYNDGMTSVNRFMNRANGQWVDVSPVLQGPAGEVAALTGVPVGEIPYKTVTGEFAGSNMRVLDDGTLLAPAGFSVESGSVTFGEALTLSEVSGFLGLTNHLNDRQYTVVDFYTPPDAASSEPSIFSLIEPSFEFVAQGVDTTNIPNNPLSFNYIVQNSARSHALKFRTYAPMTNVRAKITQVSNGVALKYIPSRQAWQEEFGGVDWVLGDNTFDFEDTPLNLNAGTQIHFEIHAQSVALKGNASNIPYFTATLQRGEFRDVITDGVYTATDVKSKLESLVSPNKLSKTAIEDAVLSVSGRTGDVVLTKADVGLNNVDNTSDVNKPTSTAQQASIDLKMSQHNAAVDPHPQYTTTAEASAAAPVQSVNTFTGAVVLDSANIAENGNLYYTDTRVGSYITANGYTVKSASSVGAGNVVYNGNIAGNISFKSITGSGAVTVSNTATEINISAPAAPVTSVNGQTGAVVLNTTNIAEASNLYYTDARVGTYLTAQGYNVKSVTNGGAGAGVFNNTSAGVVTLRSIIGTGNASVTQNANDITINVPSFPVTSVNGLTGAVVLSTTNIAEGTNLYYTDARVTTYLTNNGYTVKQIVSGGTGASVFNGTVSGTSTLRAINGTGLITVTQNANDITIAAPTVTGGTYTPTVTNVSGVTTSSVSSAQWMRVDGVVTVSGQITVDPTGAGGGASVSIGLSLPVASNFANVNECAGTAVSPGIGGQCGAILADTTNDRASFQYVSVSGSNQIWYYTYTYRVI